MGKGELNFNKFRGILLLISAILIFLTVWIINNEIAKQWIASGAAGVIAFFGVASFFEK